MATTTQSKSFLIYDPTTGNGTGSYRFGKPIRTTAVITDSGRAVFPVADDHPALTEYARWRVNGETLELIPEN